MPRHKSGKTAIFGNAVDQDLLGEVGWWTLSQNSQITHEDLVKLFDQHGFDKDLIPKPVAPKRAFRRAIEDARQQFAGEVFIPKIDKDGNDISWTTIQRVKVDDDLHEHAFHQETAVRFIYIPGRKGQEEDGVITTDFDAGQDPQEVDSLVAEVVRKIKESYYRHRKVLSMNDLRTTIKRVLDSGLAMRIRRDGGVYFVPQQHTGVVNALQEILVQIDCRWDSYPIPVGQKSKVKINFMEAFEDEVHGFMTAFKATIFKESGGMKAGLRSSTVARKLTEFNELKDKLEVYEELLSFKADDTRSKMEDIFETIMQAVDKVSDDNTQD